jgi:hypothetical protein
MLLMCYNVAYTTGNPQSRTGLAPGGAGVQNASSQASNWYDPFLAAPTLEPIVRGVLDATSNGGIPTPAAQGAVLALNPTIITAPTGLGGAFWTIPNIAGGQQAYNQVGIVFAQGSTAAIDDLPLNSGVGCEVVIAGPVYALCTAPTAGGAIALGTLLQTDGAGNLQPLQPPTAAPTPTVAQIAGATAGATTYSYALVAIGANGVYSALGTAGTFATGNATLSAVNANSVTWVPLADAVQGYLIVRTVGGASQGVIGRVPAGVGYFVDPGLVAVTGTSPTVFQAAPAAPGAPTVTQIAGAVAGTTTYTYTVASVGYNGVWSAASAAGSVTTGNATLSTTNGNKIVWTAVSTAVRYAIQRTVGGGTQGFIGFASPAQATAGFIDYGIAGTTYAQNLVATPTPMPGIVIAKSLGTLAAGTTAPTLVPVFVGVI